MQGPARPLGARGDSVRGAVAVARTAAARPTRGERDRSEPRVDRLALQREHAEHALVDPAQRLPPDEPLQRPRRRARTRRSASDRFAPEPARPQPLEVLRRRVLRAVDDPQVLAARGTSRAGWARPARAPARRTSSGLTTIPSPPRAGQLLPPARSPAASARRVGHVDDRVRRSPAAAPGRPGRRSASVSMCQSVVLVRVDARPRSRAGGTGPASGRRATSTGQQ